MKRPDPSPARPGRTGGKSPADHRPNAGCGTVNKDTGNNDTGNNDTGNNDTGNNDTGNNDT